MTICDKGYSSSITFSLSSLLDMRIPPNFEMNSLKLQHGFEFQNTSAFKTHFFKGKKKKIQKEMLSILLLYLIKL